ncbi:MAG TPA: biotin carboxylase N-terminal domain-containing protein [Streptosporangiaceae bacterium]|nr:biotin carboxylase N-terminal domain-containing protein [Streptosporangiaceae bacterium]HEX2823383.1 biotin carboxylase N-terminal domain-containing protein [Streptosporangiaceae bacterium]
MFDSVLIANRGEIAVRIQRTLRALEIRSVASYTDEEAGARHVRDADAAFRVRSYLSIEEVIAAARASGAQAVHPGYGFLAENPGLARACAASGLTFIGPPAEAIEMMGDKIRAKRTVAAAGVPVVPGSDTPGLTDAELSAAALDIGLAAGQPVLLKPSAGGGGKGMRLVTDPAGLAEAIAAARREATAAFGDGTLLVERWIASPRHIEIQVFADTHGHVIHLGERECSLQRRHQKIIEEAPSPLLSGPDGPGIRAAMGASAVAVARAVGYVGAGTVEYIVSADRPGEFFFMEMNTRLQVEHPVTEMAVATGTQAPLDLVELQLRVAAGEPLPFVQESVAFAGHAIEARIYAEDPARNFLPTGGKVLVLAEPDRPHVRVDSGLLEGTIVGSGFDPMLAKVIAWGPDRPAALNRLDRALSSYALLGVGTNVAFLRSLIADPDVRAGRLDTGLAERRASQPPPPHSPGAGPDAAAVPSPAERVPAAVLAAAALERMLSLEVPAAGPWQVPDSWRAGGNAWTTWHIAGHTIRVRGLAAAADVSVDDSDPVPASASRAGTVLIVSYAGQLARFFCARDQGTCWLGRDGQTWALRATEPISDKAAASLTPAGNVTSPMPGVVQVVKVVVGAAVQRGEPLVIIEAMKMEHTVTAPVGGIVTLLPVRPGSQVTADEVLAVIDAEVLRAPEGER